MNKLMIAALAAGSMVALAAPAAAQTATGTVNITGSVGNKCFVVPVGGGPAADFVTSRDLGELSRDDGTLEVSGTLETRFGTAGAGAPTFRVVCTTAAPVVSVRANPILITDTGLRAPANGYTGTVDYTATTRFDLTANGVQNVSNVSTAGAATSATLSTRLAASGNNVTISTSAYNTTAAGASALLNAGSYEGSIVVTVSPI